MDGAIFSSHVRLVCRVKRGKSFHSSGSDKLNDDNASKSKSTETIIIIIDGRESEKQIERSRTESVIVCQYDIYIILPSYVIFCCCL